MRKGKQNSRNGGRGKGDDTGTAEEVERVLSVIVELTDAFCESHLNEEYRQLCEEMAIELCEAGVPVNKGRLASWASGIVHAVGWVNFLQDPSFSPHMTSAQVAEGFGVSQQTMLAKSRIIRDELELIQLDPDWCLSALLADNPLVWTLDVGGFLIDIRFAPRQLQEEAYRLGLIPFIPADRKEAGPESGEDPRIIEFPGAKGEIAGNRPDQKPKDEGPSLFEGLRQ